MQLDNFAPDAFLRDFWQKKPLLIRLAFANWQNPLAPDELAGLACEEGVESRLITAAAGRYQLEHGPLPDDRFATLGARDWTLLVQAVDHQVPAVAALIEAFRFIPNWRIDDVMVSYAVTGGGVGPHFDRYDVFLLQGAGRRRWRVGQMCDDSSPLLPDSDLCLLADFQCAQEFVLEAGDMLYLPPGVAHDGVALDDDCMTYSIGFRAPSRHDLIGLWTDEVLGNLTEDDRYADPALALQPNSGEIAPEALARLQEMVAQKLLDPAGFARWFGTYSSQRKYPEIDWRPAETITPAELRAALSRGATLERNPASRFVFIEQSDSVQLFVDGQCHECSGETASFARALCAQPSLAPEPDPEVLALITQLYNEGSLAFAEED